MEGVVDLVIQELIGNSKRYLQLNTIPQIKKISQIECQYSTITILLLNVNGSEKKWCIKTLRVDEYNKSLKREQIEKEFAVLNYLSEVFMHYDNLRVVKPVALFSEIYSHVTEFCDGQPMLDFIGKIPSIASSKSFRRATDVCQNSGIWLGVLHSSTIQSSKSVSFIEDILEYCNHRLKILVDNSVSEFNAKLVNRINEFIVTQMELINPEDVVIAGCHGDFGPYNILASNNKIIVLDFGGYHIGPIQFDLFKFLSKLDKFVMHPLATKNLIEQLKNAFLKGYSDYCKIDLSSSLGPLGKIYDIQFMLDTMCDILLDWGKTHIMQKPFKKRYYKNCYLRLISI